MLKTETVSDAQHGAQQWSDFDKRSADTELELLLVFGPVPIFQEVLSSCELVIFQLKDETVLLKGFHIITQKMPEKKKKNDFMWCPEQEQDFEQIKQEIVCSAEPRCSSRGTSL